MRFFRRRDETLNERLLREADARERAAAPPDLPPPGPLLPRPAFPLPEAIAVAYQGPRRVREWDAMTTASAPELAGDAVAFATLPDGTVIVDEEQGDADLAPLAEAIEAELPPPYRARGVRSGGALWSVAAIAIEVVELETGGDTIDLSVLGGTRTLTVDGLPSTAPLPVLDGLGAREGRDHYVHAERLDGNLWEVRVSAL